MFGIGQYCADISRTPGKTALLMLNLDPGSGFVPGGSSVPVPSSAYCITRKVGGWSGLSVGGVFDLGKFTGEAESS